MKREVEYIVRDFLEMKCCLKEPEQEFLLDFLKEKGVKAGAIRLYPAFSVADCLVVIVNDEAKKRRWFYHPEQNLIEE